MNPIPHALQKAVPQGSQEGDGGLEPAHQRLLPRLTSGSHASQCDIHCPNVFALALILPGWAKLCSTSNNLKRISSSFPLQICRSDLFFFAAAKFCRVSTASIFGALSFVAQPLPFLNVSHSGTEFTINSATQAEELDHLCVCGCQGQEGEMRWEGSQFLHLVLHLQLCKFSVTSSMFIVFVWEPWGVSHLSGDKWILGFKSRAQRPEAIYFISRLTHVKPVAHCRKSQ